MRGLQFSSKALWHLKRPLQDKCGWLNIPAVQYMVSLEPNAYVKVFVCDRMLRNKDAAKFRFRLGKYFW